MSSLRSFVPGYDTGVKAPTAFTVSYAWNSDHNEAWPARQEAFHHHQDSVVITTEENVVIS